MENMINKSGNLKGQISGFGLKMIAVVTMFIDHLAAAVGERMLCEAPAGQFLFLDEHRQLCCNIYIFMRGIGRMAFPIYCFLLVEGFHYTKDAKKYSARLFWFALLSEIPFDLAFNYTVLEFSSNNVFWTLLIGLLGMMAVKCLNEHTVITTRNKHLSNFLHLVKYIALMAIVLFSMGIAEFLLRTDYGASGVAAILVMYLMRNHPQWGFTVAVVLLGLLSSNLEFAALLMLIPLYYYNGTRGRQMKYFFYAFYPVHLLMIVGLAALLGLPVLIR